jgi:hypothetical protein
MDPPEKIENTPLHPPPTKSLKVLRSPHLVYGLGATGSFTEKIARRFKST